MQGVLEYGYDFVLQLADVGFGLLVFGQQFFGRAQVIGFLVWVLDVEVVVAVDDVLQGDAPGVLVFLPLAPPGFFRVKFLDVDGAGFVVALHPIRVGVLVVPYLFGRAAFFKEEQVGLDARVGVEDAIGQAHDGVEVAAGQQFFLEAGLDAFPEKGAIGQDHGRPSAILQQPDDEGEEEVGGFLSAEFLREVGLRAVFLYPTKGRIGEDDVHFVVCAPVAVGLGEVVAALDAGHFKAMQHKVGGTEQVGQGLFLYPAYGLLQGFALAGLVDLLVEMVDGAGEEAAGTAGGVEYGFAQLWVEDVDHELGDGPGRVVFPGGAGRLQFLEDGLVEVIEEVAVFAAVEVDLIDFVDHLPEEGAVLHVVVGVLEDGAYDFGLGAEVAVEFLQGGEEFVVDEVHEGIAGEAFVVFGPVLPAQGLGDGALVAGVEEFPLGFLVGEDFEEEHPYHLGDALCVAVYAGVFAHDVAHAFDDGGDTAHWLWLCDLAEVGFKLGLGVTKV